MASVLVKRYGVDRLYDTARGCYVSVPQLRRWAATGVAFQVIDARTGGDITLMVLA
jgi:polyhydroxyalkanoate synthesis regulator protein